jgi:hypothetical protein
MEAWLSMVFWIGATMFIGGWTAQILRSEVKDLL